MKKIVFLFALSLAILTSPAYAAEPESRMTLAIEKLVESQNLDKLWPVMTESAARTGAAQVERGAREEIDKIPNLAPEIRSKAYAIIAENSAPMAAEITELHRNLPIHALVTEMARMVYTKYFSVSEIEALAKFYGGVPYQKMAHLQLELSDESARTGKSTDALQAKYMARLTPQETQAIMTFSASATGRKQQQNGAALAADLRDFLHRKTDADLDTIVQKYSALMRVKLQKLLHPE